MKRFLTALFLLTLLSQISAAKVDLRRDADQLTLSGGSGPHAWKLVYGTRPDLESQILEISPDLAYFAHGGWVRLLDTNRGVVLARWHIGPKITSLKPTGGAGVDVGTSDQEYG